MESILHQLLNGDIYPPDQIKPKGKEYEQLLHKLCDENDWWCDKLSREDYERFEEFQNLSFSVDDFHKEEHFKYGFRLASMIFLDILGC